MKFLFLLLPLLGCTGEDPECSEDVPCPFGSICENGVCQAQSCATSDQCGIEQYCKDNTCVDGCEVHADCRFGDLCDADANTCVEAECVDTHLDCGFKEFCSPAGECYEASGYYCTECGDDGDCGGNGNLCVGGYCAVSCETDAECPGGFDCATLYDFNGNPVGNGCYTRCYLSEEE
jgi:hypothetical protein